MRLSREQILRSDDIQTKVVDVPEWGGEVVVRGLTGIQRDNWEASMSQQRGGRMIVDTYNFRARLVIACCIDETGELLFQPADADELGAKSGAAINRVFEVAAELSGLTKATIDEMTENFGGTPGDNSSSHSPNHSTRPSGSSYPS